MDHVITTDNLCKHYKRSKALDGLSMHVPKGAVYGLVGKNGAGKTTLMRILCGLQKPTSGSYTLFGIDGADRDIFRSRRRIGAVVEAPAFYPDLSAEENLRQQCRILGVPSFDDIPGLLSLTGLGDTGKTKAGHFSLGMRQRLGIALALCGSPDLLVLDEPVNGLDPRGIIEMRELILRLNRERRLTVLISSHILAELAKLATHYGFLENGRLAEEISARELEAGTRKRIRLTVSDIKALCFFADRAGLPYRILSDTEADIYTDSDNAIHITGLVEGLSEEGCEVLSLQEHGESLESYYLNLSGTGNTGRNPQK